MTSPSPCRISHSQCWWPVIVDLQNCRSHKDSNTSPEILMYREGSMVGGPESSKFLKNFFYFPNFLKLLDSRRQWHWRCWAVGTTSSPSPRLLREACHKTCLGTRPLSSMRKFFLLPSTNGRRHFEGDWKSLLFIMLARSLQEPRMRCITFFVLGFVQPAQLGHWEDSLQRRGFFAILCEDRGGTDENWIRPIVFATMWLLDLSCSAEVWTILTLCCSVE